MAVRPLAAPWLAVLAVGTGATLFALAVYLRRYWGRSGAEWFIGSLSMHALWCVSYGLGLVTTTPAWRVWLEAISWVGLVWIGYLFLGFALEYTGYNDLRRSWVFPALGIPSAVSTLCLLVPSLRNLVWTTSTSVQLLGVVGLDYTIQPWGFVILVLGSSYAGVGVLLLAETIFSYGSLYRREALAVALSPAVPMVGLVVWMLDIGPSSVLNWGVMLTLPHAALDAYAFVGTNMFESSPTTRRVADRQAIETFPDPVLILDRERRLVDFNAHAAEQFDGVIATNRGQEIADLLPEYPTQTEGMGDQYLSLATDSGQVEYRVRTTPLTESGGTRVGYSVVFQDITTEREREQRLAVLNRVIRHNLRNEMTVIQGHAARITRDATDSDLAASAEQIDESGEQIVAISEKAREFDRLQQADPSFQRIEIADVLQEIVDEQRRAFPIADITVTVETDTEVYTDPTLLRIAIENVIENAVKHADTGTPQIDLTVAEASQEGAAVSIEIADDGPGIPESEVAVIEQGSESTLQHGSGIGLWIIEWSVQRLGGTVGFEQTESGTTVSLQLPTDPTRDHLGS